MGDSPLEVRQGSGSGWPGGGGGRWKRFLVSGCAWCLGGMIRSSGEGCMHGGFGQGEGIGCVGSWHCGMLFGISSLQVVYWKLL